MSQRSWFGNHGLWDSILRKPIQGITCPPHGSQMHQSKSKQKQQQFMALQDMWTQSHSVGSLPNRNWVGPLQLEMFASGWRTKLLVTACTDGSDAFSNPTHWVPITAEAKETWLHAQETNSANHSILLWQQLQKFQSNHSSRNCFTCLITTANCCFYYLT